MLQLESVMQEFYTATQKQDEIVTALGLSPSH